MSTIRWAFLPAILLLAGCGSEEFQDLKDFVNNSGADMRGKIEAPPEVKPYEPFNYNNSDGLADPFRPRKPEKPIDQSSQPDEHHKEELEEYPLESLKMVGFVYMRNTPNAVIVSPDGKLHHVKVGNYMGQNFGKITSISENEVKLVEKVQDGASEWSERTSSLQLVE